IVGGIATLGIGAVLAALAIGWMETRVTAGIVLAVIAFMLIGVGVGAAGTSLLVLLAKRVEERRRAAAATVVWVMMILGFVITTMAVGKVLDPYSASRLVAITACVSIVALALTLLVVRGIEPPSTPTLPSAATATVAKPAFREALAQVWNEPQARRFTIFVFVSMLAYSAQDLILEPFAGSVFAMTPGQSTQLSGIQNSGVLLGMILVAVACSIIGGPRLGSLRTWTILGCIASAFALAGLAAAGWVGPGWPLKANVFLLGASNGAFAVAAIGSMMALAGAGRESREGVRMGLWGAAQAIAFGLGGFLGAAGSDLARMLLDSQGVAYGIVFGVEGLLFILAAVIAAGVHSTTAPPHSPGTLASLANAMSTREKAA
ncbi:MAG: BCD family MFS transporter, partial [Dokdonella sp.]